MDRRNFLSDISIGLSAAIFLPEIIKPKWKVILPHDRIFTDTVLTYMDGVWLRSTTTIRRGVIQSVVRCEIDLDEATPYIKACPKLRLIPRNQQETIPS